MVNILNNNASVFKPKKDEQKKIETPVIKQASIPAVTGALRALSTGTSTIKQASIPAATGAIRALSTGTSTIKPFTKNTSGSVSPAQNTKATQEYKPGALSMRVIVADRQQGKDWSNASDAQKAYNNTYYRTLDDKKHTDMYLEMEGFRKNYSDEKWYENFQSKYKAGQDYLNKELADIEKRYGKESNEYKALDRFMQDYENAARWTVKGQSDYSAKAFSKQLDQNIQEIYGGLMAQPDFQEKVEEGLKDIQRNGNELRNFERMTENASDLQKNLLLYIRATEGNKGVQQFMASGLGELMTATRAADIYSKTIDNDSEAFRKAAIGAQRFFGNVGNAIPGTIELAKGITGSDKDDPDDKNLGGGYTISDSTDNYLQTTLAKDFAQAGVTNEQFKYVAELGGSGLKTEAGSTDWYKDFEKNASDYQKQVISFLYASSGEEAAKAMWEGIKDREQQVWGAVKKNSNRLATSVDEDLGALYQQYAHDFGHAAPGFLASVGGEGVTWEELLLQATGSAAEQVIPMLMGNLVGGAFRAAGAAKKATNWASRIASAAPMATMIGGRSYGEALDKGVSRGKAMGYGITEASLEFITGMLLDGAAGVGGKLTGGIRDKAVAKIASPVLRALADAGIRSWGEGTEEYVQEALEPIIASVFLDEGELVDALGETFDPRNILDPDRLYAGFLGALTAFGMAPGNVAMDIHNNNYYRALGKGFNTINATVKAADVIINNPVEGPNSDSERYEESKKTAEIVKNGGKVSDLAAGKMIVDYGSAGGDMSAITGLDTMTYNKDSIGYDDYVAGIRSVLVDMNEDVALAEDLAKLATGQTITEEAQTRINESKAAQDILSQLQGDLDMKDGKSALTRAARATVFRGTMNKIFQTLKNENPDKTVVSPATQQLLNTGLDVNAAQKIGAVIDKVLNGEAITEAEATLVKASSPAIRATVLNTLDIELSEYADKQAVMQALNDFATEAAKIKEQQAAVRQGAQPAAQARGAAMQGGLTNGIQGNDIGAAGQSNARSGQEGPEGAGAAAGSPSAAGQAPADLGRSGQRPGSNQRNAGQVHAEVTEERKQDVKRGCVESGADTVKFVVDEDSCTFYDPDDGYVIKIKTNGQFTIEQYGLHEPIHLWITYALSEDHRQEVLADFYNKFVERFGEDFFTKFYDFVEKVYGEKGYLPANENDARYQILEDMLSFCYAGQNYGMDLTACRQFARQFVEDHGLKAIGTGDFSNPKVQEALANGWINQEYYDRHGWSQEDDGTSLDISTEEAPVEQSEETPAEEPGAAERKKITDYLRKNDLEKMRKNLAKQRKLLVENARKNGDNKPGSPNYEAHRARVAELEAQIKDVESQLAELNAQHSADYEEETNEAVNTRGVQSSAPGEKTGVSQAKQKSYSVQKPKKDLRRKSPEQLQESRDLHEEEVNNLIDEDHEIVPYEQVPEEYRWITDSFAEVAPESEVTYYRDSSEDAPNMYYLPAIVKGADGGFFVNLAKLEEGEWRDDGWTLDNMVLHEKAHFWLDKAGGLAETAWRKLRGKFFVNPNQFGKFADILKAYREWCSDFYHDAEEELVCDVLGGRSIAWDWYAPELWPEARQVMQNFFSANTEYALSKEAETVDEKKSYSADYDPEYYQSIGLIDPEGQTVAFTDNIGGVHEEIINQLNGNPGEDIKDFIARGGIRVKPGSGIEVNGDIAPSVAQYDMIDKIVENFTGKEFSIDFNIDGVSAGTHTFEGADLDPNRVYSYLRNYYERRKANKVRDEKLDRFSETLGMRVKSMADAYNLAKMVAQMEGMTPELQEIIDTYEGGRYSADYDDLAAEGFWVENPPKMDQFAERWDSSDFAENGALQEVETYEDYVANGGLVDLTQQPITNDVKAYFAKAQSYDERLNDIVNGILPLFLATDTLGFSAYDPSGKSDDHRSIFLTDSLAVGASYGWKGKNFIDMKALGDLREHIARELGYKDFEDLMLPTDLYRALDYRGTRAEARRELYKMYNAVLSYKGKIPWADLQGKKPIPLDSATSILDLTSTLKDFDKLYDVGALINSDRTGAFIKDVMPRLRDASLAVQELLRKDDEGQLSLEDILPVHHALGSLTISTFNALGDIVKADSATETKKPPVRKVQVELKKLNKTMRQVALEVSKTMDSISDKDTAGAPTIEEILEVLAASGSWAVYANTTKPLVLEGNGANWNELEDAIEDSDWAEDFWDWYENSPYKSPDGSVRTRHIANYAYDRGFDSAIITNIYDVGRYGDAEAWEKPSNIYVVFNPNQIKSVNNKHPSGDKRMNYSADYAENFDTNEYLELKTEGFDIEGDVDYENYIAAGGPTDLDGAPITEDVKNYFSGAQSYDKRLYDIVNAIIPLFLATDSLGFSAYDTSESDDGRSIFLTDSRVVGASYGKKGDKLIDMKALGDLREHIARELGYEDFDDLPLPTTLANDVSAKRGESISLLHRMYSAILSYEGNIPWVDRSSLPKISGAAVGALKEFEDLKRDLGKAQDDLWSADPEGDICLDLIDTIADAKSIVDEALVGGVDSVAAERILRALKECKDEINNAAAKLSSYDQNSSSYYDIYDALIKTDDYVEDVIKSITRRLQEGTLDAAVDASGKKIPLSTILNALADSGSWAVYANTTKPLIVWGEGAHWNDLGDSIELEDWADDFFEWYDNYDWRRLDGKVNTRAIANYAYERGYDSAIILDIYDVGPYGSFEAHQRPSNIYVVFNPNQIKSVNNKHPSGDKRMNYSADYANPESEDYLGPNIDEVTRMRAQEEDIYRNQDIWKQEAEEKEADEDAIVSETTLDEDIREAREDALLAELMQGDLTPERQKELYAEYLQLQQAGINYTKHAPKQEEEAKPAPKKSPVAQAFRPKAEVEQKKKEPVKVTPKAKPAPESELQQLQREFEAAKATSDDDVDPDLLARVSAALERANIQYAEDMEREAQVAQKAEAAAQAVAEAKKPKTVKVKAKAKPVIPVAQTTETEAKPEVVVFKNDGTKFTKISKNERKSKNPKYIQNIGNAKTIEIRRRRSDRNTYDVRFNDGKGNIVAYEEISPAALTKAFAFATGDRDTAKARAGEAMAMASEPSLSWSLVPNPKVVKATEAKPEEVRATDNYGRSVPVKLTKYLENSAIRTEDGALINTYRLAPANGVHNAKMPGKVSMYTERPAPINTMRGMKGAEAFGQSGKGVAEQLSEWLDALTNPEITPKRTEEIRRQIVETEQQMRKYTNGVTRLDPNRPDYEFATPENVVNGKSLVETYLDIRKPKIIDAKGKGVDFIQQEVQKFIRDPANKAGLFDAQKNPIGPHDGFKFLNARIIPEGETLGGGEADLDTVYVTLRNNQAKSTYNTAPTDSDLIQYSADYDNAMIEEEDMRDRGILERNSEGFSDAHGNWISPEQANHFEMAKMIDQNGNLVYGIIPLFHGGRTIYFRFDPSKSTYPWFYLTTNPRVAKGYDDGGPKEVVDLKLREKLFRRLAKAMNLGNPSAALKAFKEQILSGPAEQQNQAAQKYADIINSYLRDGGKLYDKYDDKYVEDISSINAIPVNKQEFEQRLEDSMATLDDQLLLLGDAMGDLEDKMDAYKGRPERKQMDEYHALLDDLYYYAQSVLDSAKDGTAVSDDFNAWPLVLAEPIIDSETGEVLVDTHALADGIIGSIRSSADTVKDRVEDLNDLQPSFEVRYKDGGYEQLMFEELPSLATKGGATAFYANITNPLVVDGTTKDGKTGHWTKLDITGIPEMLKLFPDGKAETDDVADWAHDHGYDGVIIRNIYDTATGDDRPGFEGDDYIVFDSSKVKSVNNRQPTSGPLFNHSADYADIDTGYTEGTLEDTIIKILRDKDIDRASAALAEYMANFLQTGVLPQMENERTQNIFQPRISESQRKLLEEQLRKDIAKYGEFEPGENPAREIHFPKRTEQGVVRRTIRTVAESKNIPDRMIPAVMRDIVQGRGDDRTVVYQRMTDKAAVAYADREMRKKGYDAARAEWQGRRDQDSKVTKNDIALGELVMIEAAKAGDVDTALTTAAELAEAATNAGQVVQAIRLIKSMPASYQLYYFQRVANRLNRQYSKRIKSGKMDELKVDRDLAKAVINAKTDKDLETAINNLIQSLANQIPATMADKWNAWRYLAMLGNPKTHIRNLFGNGIFVPAKFAKDLIKAGLEGVIVKDPNQRTSSLRGLIGAPSEYRNFAEKDYEGIKKDLQAGGKYNPTNDIMQKRTIFGNKFLEWLRQKNGNLLEAEDGKFLKFHYVNALTNFLATRGVSVEALESTPDGAKVLNAARQYAFSEALKATYRDASSVASALNMIKRTNPTAGILLDGLVPFTKTPINILKRGVEYSPVGLLGTVTRGLAQLKNGDIDANQFCDNLAAGLTGTGIAVLGFWLTSLGVLKGGDDDDDKKADFDKLMGYQNYSINIGGQNFTIDWAAPSALPLFVGSAMFTELAESNGLTFADIFNASTVIAEPLTQLSMLSGINDALKSAKWDENPLSSVISSMATGYVSQGVPTWLAQIARTGAENRRTTYVDKNSDIPPAIQRWAQTNILGKIPGLNNKRAEYIDAWGRKDTEKNALVRLFDNMFAPWYRNEINITPVDKELMRLSEETGTSVLMSPADRYIEFDNQKHDLTAQQYETYAKVRGQRTFEMLGELFNSMAYQKSMTEEEKAKAVEFIKQYGNILGKQAVFPEYETDNDNWAEKCDGDTTRLLDMAMTKAQANALGVTAGNNGEFYQMVMNTDWMSPVEQGYIIAQQYNTTSETVYVRKGGPKYELTNERKDQLYEYYRLIFPEYYLQLVGTTAWQNADNEKRLEMLSKVRSDVGGIAKAWLAERLQAAGAPVYTGK